MIAPSGHLAEPAPRSLQGVWSLMCGFAFVLSVAAIAADVSGRMSLVASDGAVPRLLSAGAVALVAVLLTWSTLERRNRELSRRKAGFLVFAAGNAILYGGQLIGYLFVAQEPGIFPGWVEAAPLLVAGIPLAAGMIMLSWPPGMSRRELWGVARDGVMATTGLVTIWVALVIPAESASANSDGTWLGAFDPWTQLFGFVSLAFVAATSRRSGSLPINQLILLQVGVAIYLTSDIIGHVVPAADLQSRITYSIAGYCVSAFVVLRFIVRPALETDQPRGARLRDLWSYLVPYLPIPLAGLSLAISRLVYGPLNPGLILLGAVLVILATSVLLVDRVALSRDRRAAGDQRMASGLRASTGSAWFAALIGDTQDLVTVLDRDGRVVYQTPSILPMLGYDADDHVGRHFAELAEGFKRRDVAQLLLRATHDSADRGPHEMTLVARDGVRHVVETIVTPLLADGSDGYVLTSTDVTDRRRLRSEFADSSLRDPLTQLANREGFLARLRAEVPAAVPGSLAVALFDLAAFRDLNDSRGHDAGDHVLRAVSEALVRLPAQVHAVARTGPDEFGLIVVADPVEFSLGQVERELDEALSGVLLPDGWVERVDFDFGFTVLGPDRGSSSDLMEQADLALAEARTLPGGAMVRFDQAMRSALVDRLRAEADLREALATGRIVTHYQPVIDLESGRICGLEALARMVAKDGSVVPPSFFIPVAEGLGLIKQVGSVVLRQALRDLTLICHELQRDVSMAVNVSVEQLDDTFVALVVESLAESGVPAEQLVLELTESALAESRERAGDVLQQLRALGCSIALDDFGTGYSSMAYLADLPVDRLKIDRSFVGSMGASRKSLVLVRTLLQMTHSLGLTAVAEGVETVEQADILRGMDCERAQGYLFARPMAPQDLLLMVQVTGGLLPMSAD